MAENCTNAEVHYSTKGYYLIQDGESVAGLIATSDSGEYVQYNAKYVVLATGGFGGNAEMCEELLPHIVQMRTEDDNSVGAGMDKDGSGIQMGVWAGGRLEAEISTMNFDSTSGPDSFAGALWLDEDGSRFCNEAFAGPEINGFFTARAKRRQIVSIYDSSVSELVLYDIPSHGAFDPTVQDNIDSLMDSLDEAYTAGADSENGYYAADDLETLADYLGYENEIKENFLSSISRYNEICQSGVDTDFGKDSRLLFPIENGPFYAHVKTPTMWSGLCTTGAFVTNNNQQVLNEAYKPIEGLYATGNTCGMRFGPSYITPIPGVSIGICITLGKIMGEYLAELV